VTSGTFSGEASAYGVEDRSDSEGARERVQLADSVAARHLVGDIDVTADMRANQNNGNMIGVSITLAADGDLDFGLQDIERMAGRFVEPSAPASGLDFGQARHRLLAPDNRVIVIVGEEGTGRSIAAHTLLAYVHAERGVPCARLLLGGANEFPSLRLEAKRRRALLLTLPTEEAEVQVSSHFGADLSAAIAVLRQNDSYLIVVAALEQWRRISLGAPDSVVWYSQPADLREIARSWLAESMRLSAIDRWLGDHRIEELFAGQHPQDAVDIAALIRAAHEAPAGALDDLDLGGESAGPAELQEPGSDFNNRVMSVVNARSNWRAHLLKWHTQPARISLERNFMLAVAALPTAVHVSHAYDQALKLCERFGENIQEAKGQQGPGAIAMAQAIGARFGDDLTIVFARPGWADAVLRYFWIDRPDLVPAFFKWLADVPLHARRLRSQMAEQIGERMIRLASDKRDMTPLTSIFKVWSADRELRGVVADLCVKVARTSMLEPLIHRELLQWSKSEDRLLRRLVVDVCAGGYGAAFPEKALVRLNHAAAADDPDLDDAVSDAVMQIWRLSSMRGTVFKRLCAWTQLHDARAGKARRTFALLAALAVPEGVQPQLLEPSADGERFEEQDLVQGWRSVLRHGTDLPLKPISRWLDAAAESSSTRAQVFKILREAVDTRGHDEGPRAFINLNMLLREWERERRTSAIWEISAQVKRDLEDALFEDWDAYREHHREAYASTVNGSGDRA
jgi:hypothetical protein